LFRPVYFRIFFLFFFDLSSNFYFLFFAAYRYLLSFPTRRSSDLTSRSPARSRPGARSPSPACIRRPAAPAWNCAPETCCSKPWRSEEHTSELQSRENLVCRLLLEKKKVFVCISDPWS